ncbi:MAG TPA: peptidoglycan editing factor PgeF [Streptosporangiaceae bacterium]
MTSVPGTHQEVLSSVLELGPGIRVAVSSRAGGVSGPPYDFLNLGAGVGDDRAAVAANRERLAAACDLPGTSLAWMRQVHGTNVCYIPAGSAGPDEPADAMYTDVPGLALCVLVADCVPVLVADPGAGLVGAAHAGREGMAAGVVPALVSALTSAGAEPARMRAHIGPGICGACYEVPADMRARVATVVPAAGCTTRAGTPGLDIAAGVGAQLLDAGIGTVTADGRCTRESGELYSYRRDGTTGRFAGLVWLMP